MGGDEEEDEEEEEAASTLGSEAPLPSCFAGEWLEDATDRILALPLGSWTRGGKYHEAVSLFSAWCSRCAAMLSTARKKKKKKSKKNAETTGLREESPHDDGNDDWGGGGGGAGAGAASHHLILLHAPRRMEDLLNRLILEDRFNQEEPKDLSCSSSSSSKLRSLDLPWGEMYSNLLRAWTDTAAATATAVSDTTTVAGPSEASAKARQWLVEWQQHHERSAVVADAALSAGAEGAAVAGQSEGFGTRLKLVKSIGVAPPRRSSFGVAYRSVIKVEGPVVARRVLAWMEHLAKSGKNPKAKPELGHYRLLLEAYATAPTSSSCPSYRTNHHGTAIVTDATAAVLAESLIRHMASVGVRPDTLCYNLLLRAIARSNGNSSHHNRRGASDSKRGGGRAVAEHAQSILEGMMEGESSFSSTSGRTAATVASPPPPPDVISFGTVISCWASSGMKVHAVERAEELVRKMQESPHHLTPNAIVWNSVMSAWVKSKDPKAVDRTFEILRLLEASDEEGCQPDLVSYNTHLHALSAHASPSNDYANRADQLLRRLEEGIRLPAAAAVTVATASTNEGHEKKPNEAAAAGAVDLEIAPNVFSYNLVIDSYARSNQGMAAAHTLRRLIRRREYGLEPDAFSFNRVFSALTMVPTTSASAGADSASLRQQVERQVDIAERLLWYMNETHASGVHRRARPVVSSFATVIHAHAKLGNPDRAQRLLDAMKDDQRMWLRPTRYCYNAVISAWAASGGGLLAARKAEALLDEMQASGLSPNSHTYNAVLKCWAASGTRCCGKKAELYLERMWDLYHAGNPKVEPNDFSYNTVCVSFGGKPLC